MHRLCPVFLNSLQFRKRFLLSLSFSDKLPMEIDAEDGSTKLVLKKSANTVFGRERGFNTTDRTTSRQHLLFQTDGQTHPSVTFQVLGKNPIWLKNRKTGDIKVFRKSEHGEVAAGDWFCVSAKNPVWFHVKEVEEGEGGDSEVRGSDDSDGGANVDVSSIDPVKEFGFLVIGHEFDHYPRKMLQKVKDWDWFLEEPSKDSDEDEDEDEDGKQKGQHGQDKRKRRKKHGGGNEDEEWTGESEEELTNVRKFQKTKYHMRSKHPKKASKQSKDARKSVKRRTTRVKDDEEEEEDDETLGGFIVTDEEAGLEEDEEEEEEEFIDDDEDDES